MTRIFIIVSACLISALLVVGGLYRAELRHSGALKTAKAVQDQTIRDLEDRAEASAAIMTELQARLAAVSQEDVALQEQTARARSRVAAAQRSGGDQAAAQEAVDFLKLVFPPPGASDEQ